MVCDTVQYNLINVSIRFLSVYIQFKKYIVRVKLYNIYLYIEDGSSVFLWNVGTHLPDYTVS
jgi:hypothetical protein